MATTEIVPEDPFVIPDDPLSMPRSMRAKLAFDLRKAGASFDFIAEKLNYASPQSAAVSVSKQLKKRYQATDVEDVVQIELERLDALQLIAWRRAKDGDLHAIDRILKIMERRAKYLGLDIQETQSQGPIHNTAIFIGGSEDEYVAQLKAAREQAMSKMLPSGTDG